MGKKIEAEFEPTTEWIPEALPLPASIEALSGPSGDRSYLACSAVWRAACKVWISMDHWESWIDRYRETGVADLDVPDMLNTICVPSLHTLVLYRAATKTFSSCEIREILDRLPLIPNGDAMLSYYSSHRRTWDHFVNDTEERLFELGDVYRECRQLLDLLEIAPDLAIGEYAVFQFNEKSNRVAFGGEPHDLKPDGFYAFRKTIEANGDCVSWENIGIANPSRTKRCLPQKLASCLETVAGRGGGVRLKSEFCNPIPDENVG